MLAHESNHGPINAPDDILDRRAVDLGKRLLLLYIVQDDRRRRAEDQASSTAVEDLIGLNRRLDRLDHRVR